MQASSDHDKFFALTRNSENCCYLLLGKCREHHRAVNRPDLHRADAITNLLYYAVRRKILTAARVVIFVPTCFSRTRYCLARERAKWRKKKKKRKEETKERAYADVEKFTLACLSREV